MLDSTPDNDAIAPPRRARRAPRRKPLADMTIEEAEEYIATLQAEIDSDDCGPCRRRKLLPKIDKAEAHIVRLRRSFMLAEAQEDA